MKSSESTAYFCRILFYDSGVFYYSGYVLTLMSKLNWNLIPSQRPLLFSSDARIRKYVGHLTCCPREGLVSRDAGVVEPRPNTFTVSTTRNRWLHRVLRHKGGFAQDTGLWLEMGMVMFLLFKLSDLFDTVPV